MAGIHRGTNRAHLLSPEDDPNPLFGIPMGRPLTEGALLRPFVRLWYCDGRGRFFVGETRRGEQWASPKRSDG